MNDPLFTLAQAVYRGDLPAARTALDAWDSAVALRARLSLGMAEGTPLPVDHEAQARLEAYMLPVERPPGWWKREVPVRATVQRAKKRRRA